MSTSEPTPRPRGRKADTPRAIGPREHFIGIGILAVVMLFCTWLLIRGLAPKGVLWGAYDPSLFAAQGGAAPAPAEPAAEPVAEPATDGEPAVADGAHGGPISPGSTQPTRILPVEAPAGWQAGEAQGFPAETMYEKINGRAEAYLAYRCVSLECVTVTQAAGQGGAGGSLDVFLFDMGTPLQAFGIYTAERGPDVERVALGQAAYRAAGSVFVCQDRYYLQVMSANGSEAEGQAAEQLAQAVVAKLPAGTFAIPGAAWFPREGQKPDTLRYTLTNALGQERLDDVYSVSYDEGGKPVDAFLTRRASAGEAETLHKRYREYLAASNKVTAKTLGGVAMDVCDQGGMVDIVFHHGPWFGGVSYVEGVAPAEAVAAKLAAAVRNAKP